MNCFSVINFILSQFWQHLKSSHLKTSHNIQIDIRLSSIISTLIVYCGDIVFFFIKRWHHHENWGKKVNEREFLAYHLQWKNGIHSPGTRSHYLSGKCLVLFVKKVIKHVNTTEIELIFNLWRIPIEIPSSHTLKFGLQKVI